MEARVLKIAVLLTALTSIGATHRTPNFVVHAPTDKIARQVGTAAEHYRKQLAIEWTGQELPKWWRPCPIHVKVGAMGAGGLTSFSFDRGHVFGWKMEVQGSLERVLDSVLPHEVSHTIFASHFRRPLPRWADEGAATLIEHESERMRQQLLVEQVLHTSRRIPLKKLLSIREYPREMQNVMTLYAEGYSLANFLVQQGGKRRYMAFLEDAHRRGWEQAIQHAYPYEGIADLEKHWSEWIIAGSPSLQQPAGQMLADNADGVPRTEPSEVVVRGQSPDSSSEGRRAANGEGRSIAQADPTSHGRRRQAVSAPDPRRSRSQEAASEGFQSSASPRDSGPVAPLPAISRIRAENDGWTAVIPGRRRTENSAR